MIELSTYVFEALREDGEFVLYRGRREDDGTDLLAVKPRSEHPSVRSLEQLKHEYSIREELDPAWAAQPLALERLDGRRCFYSGIPAASLSTAASGDHWN